HHQGEGDVVVGLLERLPGGVTRDASGPLQDSNATLGKLGVLQVKVDHEIAVDVAKAGHGAGGQHIKNHFLGSAGFHAAGTGEHFRADVGDDGEVGGAFERRVAIASDGDGLGAPATGVFNGGDGERSAAAGGDADDNVILGRLAAGDLSAALHAGVLTGF